MKLKFIIFLCFIIVKMTHAQLKIDNLKEIELNTNINSEFFEKNGYFTKNGNFFFFNRDRFLVT